VRRFDLKVIQSQERRPFRRAFQYFVDSNLLMRSPAFHRFPASFQTTTSLRGQENCAKAAGDSTIENPHKGAWNIDRRSYSLNPYQQFA
jgi:hypothetical protein